MTPGRGRLARTSLVGGILVTIVLGVVFRLSDLDLTLQRRVYSATEPHWPYATAQPWKALHDAGTIPGLALTLLAVGAVAVSVRRHQWLRWQNRGLYLFAFLAAGPGLVTNLLGKMLAGRPRPDEIVQFGGALPFHRPFEFGVPMRGYSFLCGHCSMGFLFFTLFFILQGWTRWAALLFGSVYGLALGAARVVQGAHFVSDVLLDGSLMFVVAALLSPILDRRPLLLAGLSRRKLIVASATTMVIVTIVFLFSTPVRKEQNLAWVWPGQRAARRDKQTLLPWLKRGRAATRVTADAQRGEVEIAFRSGAEPLVIESLVRGFGFPGADVETSVSRSEDGSTISYAQRLAGGFWEARPAVRILIGTGLQSVRASCPKGRVIVDGSREHKLLRVFTLARQVQISRPWERRTDHFERAGGGPPLILAIRAGEIALR